MGACPGWQRGGAVSRAVDQGGAVSRPCQPCRPCHPARAAVAGRRHVTRIWPRGKLASPGAAACLSPYQAAGICGACLQPVGCRHAAPSRSDAAATTGRADCRGFRGCRACSAPPGFVWGAVADRDDGRGIGHLVHRRMAVWQGAGTGAARWVSPYGLARICQGAGGTRNTASHHRLCRAAGGGAMVGCRAMVLPGGVAGRADMAFLDARRQPCSGAGGQPGHRRRRVTCRRGMCAAGD